MSQNKNENEITEAVLVPERWLQSLLELAYDFDSAFKEYKFGDFKNDKIINKGVMLMGYAKSASSIIDSNERVKIKNGKR